MTTKTLTSDYAGGYTLSSSFTGVSITKYAYLQGVGLLTTALATVVNAGSIRGTGAYKSNGTGQNGIDLAFGGVITDTGNVRGGLARQGTSSGGRGLPGSAGGAAILAGATSTITTSAFIYGGAGGGGGESSAGAFPGGRGGAGGAAIAFTAGVTGTVTNSGTLLGGTGGTGGAGISGSNGGTGGVGGAGVYLAGAGTVINSAGTIKGGAGGSGGVSTISGAAGAMGDGVQLTAGGSVINHALITGGIGVYAQGASAVTVTNYASIVGTAASVQFGSASDRLIVKNGAAFTGLIKGGGGTLEIAVASGTITGLGATGTLAGGPAGTFSGFGTYALDSGDSWVLAGGALAGGQTLSVAGNLTNTATFTDNGVLVGTGTLSNALGATITGANGLTAGSGSFITVSNIGTIAGTGGTAVAFGSSGDWLQAASGAVFTGSVLGGGGTVEFDNASGTIVGLGVALTASDVTGTFSGFATYRFDTPGTWALSGVESLAAGQTLLLNGSGGFNLAGTLVVHGTVDGGVYGVASGPSTIIDYGNVFSTGGDSVIFKNSADRFVLEAGGQGAFPIVGGGGVFEFGGGSDTLAAMGSAAGTVSGAATATLTGFGSYQIDSGATLTLAGSNTLLAGQTLTANGLLRVTGALQRSLGDQLNVAANLYTGSGGTILGAGGTVGASGTFTSGGGGTGGAAVTMTGTANLSGYGTIIGGAGGEGGQDFYNNLKQEGTPGAGGFGGAAVVGNSGGGIVNHGLFVGGAGGAGRPSGNIGGVAGGGGVGVTLTVPDQLTNFGAIRGGAGGYGGSSNNYYFPGDHKPHPGAGGSGGAGVAASASVVVGNIGTITGGAGGQGGYMPGDYGQATDAYYAAAGGAGGAGVVLTGGGRLLNAGSITGGGGGMGGKVRNSTNNVQDYGAGGVGGAGVVMGGGVTLQNYSGATISGGVGGSGGSGGGRGSGVSGGSATIFNNGMIVGGVGVSAGAGMTVFNYATIQGLTGPSVSFTAASDRLILEAGASCIGNAVGGGGALELAKAVAATITGIGGTAAVTGNVAGAVTGFGTYQIDGGASAVLAGSGTIAAGHTLIGAGSIAQLGTLVDLGLVSISGSLTSGAGASTSGHANGGPGPVGLTVAGAGVLLNAGTIVGGAGGSAGQTYFLNVYTGGAGGAGVAVTSGSASNTGSILGGTGGRGGFPPGGFKGGGDGGVGGAGVALSGGSLTNAGTIMGGTGGTGGDGTFGGTGGAGVVVSGSGTLTNTGRLVGGTGGGGYNGYNGTGGFGVSITGGVAINLGSVLGGAKGTPVYDAINGAYGDGAGLTGGALINGSTSNATAVISGVVGVYVAPGDAATVTNYATIHGSGGVAVQFGASGDRLIVESGSSFQGGVHGGGGTLELANGTGTLTSFGAGGIVTGAEAFSASGFGAYQFDAGSNWTLGAADTLSANQTVINFANLTGALILGAVSDRLIAESGSTISGAAVAGGGGTLELNGAAGTIASLGGAASVSGAMSLSMSGFGSYVIDTGVWTLAGASALGAGDYLGLLAATLTNTGSLSDLGTIGGAGTLINAAGIQISGDVVANATSSATVFNLGTLTGGAGVALQFLSKTDRLVVGAGGAFVGAVKGGGGTLELNAATGILSGLGSTLTVSTAPGTFSGFGAYVLDAGGAWTLAGSNLIASGQSLTDTGPLTNSGTFTDNGTFSLTGTLTNAGSIVTGTGVSILGAGAIVNQAHELITGVVGVNLAPGTIFTVTNYGTIQGTGGTSVNFGAAADRLIVESGSSFVGLAKGDGGTLELTAATGTFSGLGSAGKFSDAPGSFSGFGSYVLDAGGTWTAAGASFGDDQTLMDNAASLTVTGALNGFTGRQGNAGTITSGAGENGGAALITGAGVSVVVSSGGALNGGNSGTGGVVLPGAGGTEGAPGASGTGGTGLQATALGAFFVSAGAQITGGNGAHGYNSADRGGAGGAGGAGVSLAGAGSTFTNAGLVAGGFGNTGGYSSNHYAPGDPKPKAANGGRGGVALSASANVSIANTGSLSGGAGGSGGYMPGDYGQATNAYYASAGGVGGAGASLGAGGLITNSGRITGGQGGHGGECADSTNDVQIYGAAGRGGAAVILAGGASLINYASGHLYGGAGNSGGSNSTGGDGVDVGGGGSVTNHGVISGNTGVFDSGGGPLTVFNYGTIIGGGGTAISFNSSSDRLIAGQFSSQTGVANGDGGALEFGAGVIGTLTGLGGTISLTGSETGAFHGFSTYQIDAFASLTATGANSITAGHTLSIAGYLLNKGTLSDATGGVSLFGGGTVSNAAGATITGAPAVYGVASSTGTLIDSGQITGTAGTSVLFKSAGDRLVVKAGGTLTGAVAGGGGVLELAGPSGTISGFGGGSITAGQSATFSGFGVYQVDAGTSWTLPGSASLGVGETLSNLGTFTETGSGLTLAGGGVVNAAGGVIVGVQAVYGAAGSSGTVTNAGLLKGTGADAVLFKSAGDRLIIDQGGAFTGSLVGGGGVLELYGGYNTISFNGGSGVISGADSATFSGFATFQVDLGDIQQLSAGALIGAGQSFINNGFVSATTVTVNGVLQNTHFLDLFGPVGVAGTLINSGTIQNYDGITLGGYLDNLAGGVINGKTIGIAGVVLTGSASASNAGAITGGQAAFGAGATGVAGVVDGSTGLMVNSGAITGGYGGTGVNGGTTGGTGGTGGAGVYLSAAGSLSNLGLLVGGKGGEGGLATNGGNGGYGGAGVYIANAGATVSNSGTLQGGAGGAGRNAGKAGSPGPAGYGASILNGTLINGSAASTLGLATGYVGVDGAAGGAATVINFATISGSSGYAVYFNSTSDRLILENGAVFNGKVAGGGGVLELAAAGGTVTGLGTEFERFGAYQLDAGAPWTLAGANTISAGHTFNNLGTALVAGTLTNAGQFNAGTGVVIESGARGINSGTIAGGLGSGACGAVVQNGGYLDNATGGLILGFNGVVGGTGATVVTSGAIQGQAAGAAVDFTSPGGNLVVKAGASFVGKAIGGGGVLDLYEGGGTISGVGGTGTVTGAVSFAFSGFSDYGVGAGSWTMSGGTLGAGVTFGANKGGTLNLTGVARSSGTLTASTGATIVAQGTVLAPGAVSELVTDKNSTIHLANAAVIQISGVSTNAGTISLSGTTSNTDLRVMAGGATLTGGGHIVLAGADARILGISPAATLTNLDNTITGIGVIGNNVMTFINAAAGVVDAIAGQLQAGTKGELMVNVGLMEASGGGTLVIANSTVANATGTIEALAGSHVDLTNTDVRGGSIIASGTGVAKFNVSGGELDGTTNTVSLSGVAFVVNGSNETLEGSIANSGKINLIASTSTSDLIIGAAGATLSGGGQVNMTNSLSNRIYGLASGDTLTNVDNRIDGAGVLGNGTMTLVNAAKGQIVGNQNLALTIDTGTNTIANAGLIENVGKGGTLVKSAVNNTGTLLAATAGTLTLAGAVTGAGVGQINGGTLYVQQAFAEKVTFTGSTGVLELGASQAFTGKVVGLSTTGTSWLDLVDIGFFAAKTKATYSGTTASGTLTVTDGTHTAHIALQGNYLSSTWTLSGDGHGGTKVVDPAPAAAQASPLQPLVAAIAAHAPAPPAGPAHASASSPVLPTLVRAP